MAQRNTKLIIRNDTTENWKANEDVILMKAEPGIEFAANKDGETIKIKIGDGITKWKDLPYFGDITELINKISKLEQKSVITSEMPDDDEVLILNCGGAAGVGNNGN